jgi:ankyrin repeat protein
MVKLLLEHGADIHATDGSGNTALHVAVSPYIGTPYRERLKTSSFALRAEAVQVLIEHGADVKRPNRFGATPFWIAVERRNTDVLDQLVVAGVDPTPSEVGGNAFFSIEQSTFGIPSGETQRQQEWQLFQWLL